ncbi:MAG: hypothetical protein Q9167_003953 [Letrouitia subvulpina]
MELSDKIDGSHFLTAETPPMRRQGTIRDQLLHFLSNQPFFLPFEGGQLLVERHRVGKEDESTTVTGLGNLPRRFVTSCQKYGEADKVLTFVLNPKECRAKQGYWREFDSRMGRTFESISLPEGVEEAMVKDMNRWSSDSERRWNADCGRVHKICFLLSGPPGNGKSSLIIMVASKWNLPIYTVLLRDLSDHELSAALTEVKTPCILLFDEIDDGLEYRSSTTDPTPQQTSQVSIGTLNGLLDGPLSKNDVVVFLTTNKPKELPETMTRTGRVDRSIELTKCTRSMATNIFRYRYRHMVEGGVEIEDLAKQFGGALADAEFSGAEISSYLDQYRDARDAVKRYRGLMQVKVSG